MIHRINLGTSKDIIMLMGAKKVALGMYVGYYFDG